MLFWYDCVIHCFCVSGFGDFDCYGLYGCGLGFDCCIAVGFWILTFV